MQRKKTFLVVWISITTVGAGAQSPSAVPVDKIIYAPRFEPLFRSAAPGTHAIPALFSPVPPPRLNAVDGSYYATQMGFFCKEELSIQKTTRLPVFFRLGSLEYVNKLEGK